MIRGVAWAVYGLLVLIGGLSIVGMMGLSMADALMRQFDRSILGASEISEALMVVAVACALPVSVFSGKAISVDIVIRRLPAAVKSVLAFLVISASIVMLGFFAYRLQTAGFEAADFGEASGMLSIPYGPFYFCLAAGIAISAIALLFETRSGALVSADDHAAPTAVADVTATANRKNADDT